MKNMLRFLLFSVVLGSAALVLADTPITVQSGDAGLLWGAISPLSDGGFRCNLHLRVPELWADAGYTFRELDVVVVPCASACMPAVLSRAQQNLPY